MVGGWVSEKEAVRTSYCGDCGWRKRRRFECATVGLCMFWEGGEEGVEGLGGGVGGGG